MRRGRCFFFSTRQLESAKNRKEFDLDPGSHWIAFLPKEFKHNHIVSACFCPHLRNKQYKRSVDRATVLFLAKGTPRRCQSRNLLGYLKQCFELDGDLWRCFLVALCDVILCSYKDLSVQNLQSMKRFYLRNADFDPKFGAWFDDSKAQWKRTFCLVIMRHLVYRTVERHSELLAYLAEKRQWGDVCNTGRVLKEAVGAALRVPSSIQTAIVLNHRFMRFIVESCRPSAGTRDDDIRKDIEERIKRARESTAARDRSGVVSTVQEIYKNFATAIDSAECLSCMNLCTRIQCVDLPDTVGRRQIEAMATLACDTNVESLCLQAGYLMVCPVCAAICNKLPPANAARSWANSFKVLFDVDNQVLCCAQGDDDRCSYTSIVRVDLVGRLVFFNKACYSVCTECGVTCRVTDRGIKCGVVCNACVFQQKLKKNTTTCIKKCATCGDVRKALRTTQIVDSMCFTLHRNAQCCVVCNAEQNCLNRKQSQRKHQRCISDADWKLLQAYRRSRKKFKTIA